MLCENTVPENTESIFTIAYYDKGILKEGQAFVFYFNSEEFGWFDLEDKKDYNGSQPILAWYKVPKYNK